MEKKYVFNKNSSLSNSAGFPHPTTLSGNLCSSKPSSITEDILFAFSMPSKLVADREC